MGWVASRGFAGSAELRARPGRLTAPPPPVGWPAATVYPSMAIGARGAILALACALPEKCVALYELVRQGHHEKARALQSILARVSKLVGTELGIAGIKQAMDLRGYRGGDPRPPLLPLHAEQKKRFTDLLAALEPAVARA